MSAIEDQPSGVTVTSRNRRPALIAVIGAAAMMSGFLLPMFSEALLAMGDFVAYVDLVPELLFIIAWILVFVELVSRRERLGGRFGWALLSAVLLAAVHPGHLPGWIPFQALAWPSESAPVFLPGVIAWFGVVVAAATVLAWAASKLVSPEPRASMWIGLAGLWGLTMILTNSASLHALDLSRSHDAGLTEPADLSQIAQGFMGLMVNQAELDRAYSIQLICRVFESAVVAVILGSVWWFGRNTQAIIAATHPPAAPGP